MLRTSCCSDHAAQYVWIAFIAAKRASSTLAHGDDSEDFETSVKPTLAACDTHMMHDASCVCHTYDTARQVLFQLKDSSYCELHRNMWEEVACAYGHLCMHVCTHESVSSCVEHALGWHASVAAGSMLLGWHAACAGVPCASFVSGTLLLHVPQRTALVSGAPTSRIHQRHR